MAVAVSNVEREVLNLKKKKERKGKERKRKAIILYIHTRQKQRTRVMDGANRKVMERSGLESQRAVPCRFAQVRSQSEARQKSEIGMISHGIERIGYYCNTTNENEI